MSSPETTSEFVTLITTEMEISGLQPEDFPVTAFAAYLDLLVRWNRAYNLTGIRDHNRMITHHILDSLSVLPFVRGNHCLDVGTGAGLPGLILALAMPGKQWFLLDSNHKKIRFVRHAIQELRISNIEAVCSRVEDYNTDKQFSTIITRAFGRLNVIYECTRHLITSATSLLVMKGENILPELEELDKSAMQVKVHKLNIPGVSNQRTLVEIRPVPSPC